MLLASEDIKQNRTNEQNAGFHGCDFLNLQLVTDSCRYMIPWCSWVFFHVFQLVTDIKLDQKSI